MTTSVYDAAGRVAERLDSLGGRVTWSYDPTGNPLVVDGAAGRYTRTFDPKNQVVSLTIDNGDALQWLRDSLGRRQVLIDPDAGRATYAWNLTGQVR